MRRWRSQVEGGKGMMGSDGMYLNSPVFYASLVPKDTFSNSTFFHSPVLMQSVCQQRRERGSYLLKMFALLGLGTIRRLLCGT